MSFIFSCVCQCLCAVMTLKDVFQCFCLFCFFQQEDESAIPSSTAMPDSATVSEDTQQLPRPIHDIQAEASHIINLKLFFCMLERELGQGVAKISNGSDTVRRAIHTKHVNGLWTTTHCSNRFCGPIDQNL